MYMLAFTYHLVVCLFLYIPVNVSALFECINNLYELDSISLYVSTFLASQVESEYELQHETRSWYIFYYST